MQGVQRGARRGAGAGINQVGDGFCLGQVHLVVEKSPLGEFTGAGLTSASSNAGGHQHVQDHRAAMALKFRHIFPGKGMRGRKGDDQALVENLPFLITETSKVRHSR